MTIKEQVTPEIRPDDMKKLQHTLGAILGRYPKNKWGWRNYYCAGSGAQEAMQRLVVAGLASVGHVGDTQTYFHATIAGCRAAGLDAAGVKRAMEGQS